MVCWDIVLGGYYRKGEGMARTSSTREMIGADLREAVQPADLVVLVSVFVFECSVEHCCEEEGGKNNAYYTTI